jgi:hypothetical protein
MEQQAENVYEEEPVSEESHNPEPECSHGEDSCSLDPECSHGDKAYYPDPDHHSEEASNLTGEGKYASPGWQGAL